MQVPEVLKAPSCEVAVGGQARGGGEKMVIL